MEQFLDYAKQHGFTHVELSINHVWDQEKDVVHIDKIRTALDERGLKLAAIGANNDFVVVDPQEVDFQVSRMRRVVEIAGELGTDVLRTEGGRPKDGVSEDRWVDAIAGCLERCLEFIEPAGMHLAVDNHGVITNDADLQIEIIERVNSPYVGASLDTMNYRWMGHDHDTIRRYYELVAPYTMYTHFKDGTGARKEYRGTALGDGEIDLDYALECLLKADYKGVWAVEYEGKEPIEGYAQGINWLRSRLEK